jgi:hypothetical protein
MKYKYEVNIKAEVKVDGKLKYVIDGGNTYCLPRIKQTGYGTYSEDGGITKKALCGYPDIEIRSVLANVTDRIMGAIFVSSENREKEDRMLLANLKKKYEQTNLKTE